MKTIEIAGLSFGQGPPQICLPLTAQDLPSLLAQMTTAQDLPAGLYEWRADLFRGPLTVALEELCQKADKPLLCTLRTRDQGGQGTASPEEYEEILLEMMETGGFSLLDVELAQGQERALRLIRAAHRWGLGIICSHHDFQKTPTQGRMVAILEQMKALGADLPKLAVMPNSPRDVLRLMDATLLAYERLGPVVTMSMGPLGQLSRVAGGLIGSCMTFGAGTEASAPGQLPAEKLCEILQALDQ